MVFEEYSTVNVMVIIPQDCLLKANFNLKYGSN
jgi:hypothetical protein